MGNMGEWPWPGRVHASGSSPFPLQSTRHGVSSYVLMALIYFSRRLISFQFIFAHARHDQSSTTPCPNQSTGRRRYS